MIKVFKNTLFAYKVLWKESKSFVFLSLLSAVISALSSFSGILLVSGPIYAIEQGLPFRDFIVIALVFGFLTGLLRTVDSYLYYNVRIPKDKLIYLKLLEKYKSVPSLKFDYELLERKENLELFEQGAYGIGAITNIFYNSITLIDCIITIISAAVIVTIVNNYLILIIVALLILKSLISSKVTKLELNQWGDTLPDRRKIYYCNDIIRRVALGKDLRVFHLEKYIGAVRGRSVKSYLTYFKKLRAKTTSLNIVTEIIGFLIEISVYGFTAYEVIKHNMLIATFTFMVSSLRTLISDYDSLLGTYLYMRVSSERIDDMKLIKNEIKKQEYEINEYHEPFQSLEFKNVTYAYYASDTNALDNVSFKLNNQEKLALVGFNGAGKTTLIKLACGLYHPTSGEILLNGINIERFDRKVLASYFAPVFQDIKNYTLTIEENITFSSKEDKEKLNRVLSELDLDKKVASLPLKEKTILGKELDEEGIDLSGGENQKITLARSLYKNANVKILDEPTSSLDAIAEAKLYETLNDVLKDFTTIFISHRLSSTKFCDHIILLDNGKIIEKGTHQELIKQKGKYYELYTLQANYYKEGSAYEQKEI